MQLFHPDSLAAKRPDLTIGHGPVRLTPAKPVELFILYENPSDYRGKYVLRRWVDQVPGPPLAISTNLVEVLAKLPKNVRCLGRRTGEDPTIKDVWTPVY